MMPIYYSSSDAILDRRLWRRVFISTDGDRLRNKQKTSVRRRPHIVPPPAAACQGQALRVAVFFFPPAPDLETNRQYPPLSYL